MNEQLANGLILLAMGMGFVLCFLVILIFAMLILKNVVAYLNKLCKIVVGERRCMEYLIYIKKLG